MSPLFWFSFLSFAHLFMPMNTQPAFSLIKIYFQVNYKLKGKACQVNDVSKGYSKNLFRYASCVIILKFFGPINTWLFEFSKKPLLQIIIIYHAWLLIIFETATPYHYICIWQSFLIDYRGIWNIKKNLKHSAL